MSVQWRLVLRYGSCATDLAFPCGWNSTSGVKVCWVCCVCSGQGEVPGWYGQYTTSVVQRAVEPLGVSTPPLITPHLLTSTVQQSTAFAQRDS